MITFWTKSLLSLPLVFTAWVSLFTIFELLGRPEKRYDPKTLRFIHRLVGYLSAGWILVITAFCLTILRASQGEPSPRTALHMLTGVLTLVLLAVKVLLARFYRKLYPLVAPIGITVFTLLLTTLALSAGTYLLARPGPVAVSQSESLVSAGRDLFRIHCADCHSSDSEEAKIGPGLKGLRSRGTLPASGRPVTEETLRRQLEQPFKNMPSFAELTESEKQALVAYLMSL